MQVLLTRSVDDLGEIGDIVNVKSGYARNYLLPQGLAAPVTDANLRLVAVDKKRRQESLERREEELTQLAERLSSASVTIQARANEEGRLFGSVDAGQIADALSEEGYPVEAEMALLDEPIREVGVYDVPIQVKPDTQAVCKVWVVRE